MIKEWEEKETYEHNARFSNYFGMREKIGGTTMKLKKEHTTFLNETAKIDFDSAMQMVDGVNMLSEDEYRLVYWEDGILKDAYKNCEG